MASSSYHTTSVPFTTATSSGTALIHHISSGDSSKPVIVLLHGFPSSSNQFRNFITLLSGSYYVLAPDLPGFGLTTMPDDFVYTFENLASTTAAWLSVLGIKRFAMYIFDYGAPVGLRIALSQPESVRAIISQNGNAYEEGFGPDFWAPVFNLWKSSNSPKVRETIASKVFTLEGIKGKYTGGTPSADIHLLNPATWHYDYYTNIAGPERATRQLDLFYDYRTNVDLYPRFQQYFRDSGVPILAVWAKGDPAFIPAGAEAFKKDSKDVVVRMIDAGHFALETKGEEVAKIILEWLGPIEI